jgi:hypothetical protein
LVLAVVWFLLKATCTSVARRINAGEGETFPESLDPDTITISAGFGEIEGSARGFGFRVRGRGVAWEEPENLWGRRFFRWECGISYGFVWQGRKSVATHSRGDVVGSGSLGLGRGFVAH